MREQTQIQKKSLRKKLEPWAAYLWMAPTIIMVLLFVMTPVVNTFVMAFSEVSKAGFLKGWNNFENFTYIFKQEVFPRVMVNTVVWVIIIVGVCMILSIALALVLNENFKGRKFVRTVLLLPWATSQFVFACCWKYIFNYEFGNLNALLIQLGLIKENINQIAVFLKECFVYDRCTCHKAASAFLRLEAVPKSSEIHDHGQFVILSHCSSYERLRKKSDRIRILCENRSNFSSFGFKF